MSELADIDDEIIVKLSDYLDGSLTGDEKAAVEKKIAEDPTWKRAHEELAEGSKARDYISGLRTAHPAPSDTFVRDVTEKINKRSAGRFFGKKTFGDRVPFGALLAVALVGLVIIGYMLWSSSTGSLKVDRGEHEQPTGSGSALLPTNP
jgi:anti-sigma factor RsiW